MPLTTVGCVAHDRQIGQDHSLSKQVQTAAGVHQREDGECLGPLEHEQDQNYGDCPVLGSFSGPQISSPGHGVL